MASRLASRWVRACSGSRGTRLLGSHKTALAWGREETAPDHCGHGGEVVRAEQKRSGLLHRLERERPAAVPGEGREKRRADAFSAGSAGRVGGCGARRCGTRRSSDGRCGGRGSRAARIRRRARGWLAGRMRLSARWRFAAGTGATSRKRADLREGVDAGVGAAGALGETTLAGEAGDASESVPWMVARPDWAAESASHGSPSRRRRGSASSWWLGRRHQSQ